MTANRVIDDHKELDNIGSHTHDQIDEHITDTPFLVTEASPSAGSARVLEAGTGITIDDAGPGGNLTISATVQDYIFPGDLTVSLTSGRTFGRYASGETIPATGKTPAEVILMAIAEPIPPTVDLESANILTSAFNTTGMVATTLAGNYAINSAGASVSSAELQYRTGNSGDWTTLSTSTSNPLEYNHVFEATPFYSTTINYRYVVTDSQGATNSVTSNIVPQSYASPTMSLSVARITSGGISGESNTKREKGNVGSTLTGTITRQRPNVAITSYSVQYSTNNSTWSDVPGLSNVAVVGNPASITIPSTTHDDATLKSSSNLYYRIRVVDEYQTTSSSSTTISFLNTIWYGPAENIPTTSAEVRSLTSKIFTDAANPFNLETGSTYKNFSVALPAALSITEVLDLDALNANITDSYVLTNFVVEDGGGVGASYDVYTMSNAIAYSSNHRHRVTRA